ncbi:hypothetical protein Dimus_035177 [Dionaea muscipula]
MKLFDAHCHLQDPRIFNQSPQLIRSSLDSGVVHFAVNGVSEKDWHRVKQMGEAYPCIIPCFGVHPWFITERTPSWLNTLRQYLDSTPSAAVGEIGLDKGTKGRDIDFTDQVDVFRQQLVLARELKKPASVHCVRAFGELLDILRSLGPFNSGVVLHSYLGSAEMVPELAKLGGYFSFSGFLMDMKPQKAKKMLKAVPAERILLETDSPDALPKSDFHSLFLVEGDPSIPQNNPETSELSLPKGMLNHPANIHKVLEYVASLLEISEEELARITYSNATRVFSYQGSKVLNEEG